MLRKFQIPKYVIGGIFNTALSYIIFISIFSITESVLLALLLVSIVGTTLSFIYNKRIVFMKSHKSSLKKFILLQVLIITINWLILHLASVLAFSRIEVQFFLAGIFAILNYLISSKFIFVNTI